MDATDRLIVITGGPGSGKTTLIEALAKHGLAVRPEAGRAIIRDQLAIGGEGLPWKNRALFAELMLAADLRSYDEARRLEGAVFFDRGLPDIAGYLTLCGLPVPPHVEAVARRFRYRRSVFIAPPWPAIFGQDAERRQDFAEAERTCAVMARIYPRYGYDLVELPLTSVESRLDFILQRLDTAA
ncbi:AAA family ATPase [Hyphomicrobiales bacterium]|nr:AAA family ATPase [Hyphomicrobiales bacterium]CAH1701064.1 AAA family ATPase [Hyphomicrobiales bacterium]CAI0344123.1 AAA family ATPase [Hyphomicrobiales bacterium]